MLYEHKGNLTLTFKDFIAPKRGIVATILKSLAAV